MTDAIEVALRSTHTIVNHLVQKSGASKAAKAPQDTDYKAVLDTFVADLLTVLYRPEWPAASLFLTILSKILVRRDFLELANSQMGALNDRNKNTTEANAARTVALDYLGDIAARLRALHLEMAAKPIVPSLDEIISEANVEGMATLLAAEASIQTFLTTAARDDTMFEVS